MRTSILDDSVSGRWGASYINEEFKQLLASIFGDACMRNFAAAHPSAMVELMTSFEQRKFDLKPAAVDKKDRYIPVPVAFIQYYEETFNKTVEQKVQEMKVAGVSFIAARGQLKLSADKMRELFDSVVTDIVDHLNSMPELKTCQSMFLVGGFGSSDYLRSALRSIVSHY